MKIARVPEVVCPQSRAFDGLPAGDSAMIHAAPMFRYKQWTKSGWCELAAALTARGLSVIAMGGPAESERCVAWWEDLDINALEIAKGLWESRRRSVAIEPQAPSSAGESRKTMTES
jgi:hypothetical protein